MANNIIERIWNQNAVGTIEDLSGSVFQAEAGAHTFVISGVDNAGTEVALSGTVAGVFMKPDNTDVPLTGSISNGKASVTLTAECYTVPGRFGLTIFVTSGSVKTAVYAAVGTVSRTNTGNVSASAEADVVDLINRINAAVATVPASWSGLMADIAPTYSASAVYPVGAYVYYNGDLYRSTTAITTAESWTPAHWTAAVLGNDVSDLKTAIDYTNNILVSGYKKIPGYYIGSNGVISAGSNYDLHCFQVSPGATINSITDSGAIVYAFYTDVPQIGSTSYNGSRIVRTVTTEENVSVPSTANWIAIRSPASGTVTITPTSKTINDIVNTITANANVQSAINADTAQKIDDLDCDYIHRFEFSMYGWTANAGGLPTANTSVSRFRTSTFYHFRKGETISVKWTGMQIFPIYCDANGICLNIVGSWVDSITFDQDRYAYFNFKSDDISSFNSIYQEYGYMVHMVNTSKSAWNGKTWYCFGTSMSDINPDGTTGNNGTMGKYPLVIDELSGMTRTNKAIGSGGICPGASHGGNVKANIMECPYDVDLVTLECGLNDWGSVTLGTIGDKSNDTFIGNFTQCIEYLTYHTRAKVVLITMVGTTYTDSTQTTRRSPFFKNSFGYYYRDYLDAMIKVCEMYGVEVIDGEANAMSNGRLNKQTVRDSIHLTYLGGQIFGRYVWSKLKDILGMPNILETMA